MSLWKTQARAGAEARVPGAASSATGAQADRLAAAPSTATQIRRADMACSSIKSNRRLQKPSDDSLRRTFTVNVDAGGRLRGPAPGIQPPRRLAAQRRGPCHRQRRQMLAQQGRDAETARSHPGQNE